MCIHCEDGKIAVFAESHVGKSHFAIRSMFKYEICYCPLGDKWRMQEELLKAIIPKDNLPFIHKSNIPPNSHEIDALSYLTFKRRK